MKEYNWRLIDVWYCVCYSRDDMRHDRYAIAAFWVDLIRLEQVIDCVPEQWVPICSYLLKVLTSIRYFCSHKIPFCRDSVNRNTRTASSYKQSLPRYGPPTRTEYRLTVENLSSRVSWQVSYKLTILFLYL